MNIKINPRTRIGIGYGYGCDGPRTMPDIIGTWKTAHTQLDNDKCYQSFHHDMSFAYFLQINKKWVAGFICQGYCYGQPQGAEIDCFDHDKINFYGEPFFVDYREVIK